MDLDDLRHAQECYECGCLYIEKDEEKFLMKQLLCKKCISLAITELKTEEKLKEVKS